MLNVDQLLARPLQINQYVKIINFLIIQNINVDLNTSSMTDGDGPILAKDEKDGITQSGRSFRY